jgi:hypothetical protein
MRTRLAVLGTVCAVMAAVPASAHAQNQALSAPGFTTQFPAGWTQATHKNHGYTLHTLMSPGTQMTSFFHSVPKSGGIAVTVSSISAAGYKHLTHHTAPKSGLAMVHMIGVPTIAKHVTVATKLKRYTLDGMKGVTAAFNYTYKGVKNYQLDVTARKGNRLILIELNCRPDLAPTGQAGMNVVLSGWHWS